MKSGWRHNECVQRIERVFSHAHRILFDACRRLPLRERLIPQRRVRTSSAMGTAVAWGSQPRKVRRKKKRERGEEESPKGKRRKEKKKHAKWKAVSEPLREEPCFLLISLIHRFLSYMAVCLTNLMVFFPLPESGMAVTPATLAIFWSQYGNGNRQP